jgi:hypothetical protein
MVCVYMCETWKYMQEVAHGNILQPISTHYTPRGSVEVILIYFIVFLS